MTPTNRWRHQATTGINQLYQAGFTKLPTANHRMHFVLAVLDCFSRYLLVLRVSPTCSIQDLTQGLDEALKEARKVSKLGKDRLITLVTDSGPTVAAPAFSDYISSTPFHRAPCATRPFRSLGMIKRLMWTVKDEEISMRKYRNPIEAQFLLERFRCIYNFERPHQALRYRYPGDFFCRKSDDSA